MQPTPPQPGTPADAAETPRPSTPATPPEMPRPGNPVAPAEMPRPGWAPFLRPGVRVTLRYAIDRRTSPGGVGRTDALGYISAVDDDTVTVMTKRGEDRVVRGLVVAAKEVPPPPVRPVRRAG